MSTSKKKVYLSKSKLARQEDIAALRSKLTYFQNEFDFDIVEFDDTKRWTTRDELAVMDCDLMVIVPPATNAFTVRVNATSAFSVGKGLYCNIESFLSVKGHTHNNIFIHNTNGTYPVTSSEISDTYEYTYKYAKISCALRNTMRRVLEKHVPLKQVVFDVETTKDGMFVSSFNKKNADELLGRVASVAYQMPEVKKDIFGVNIKETKEESWIRQNNASLEKGRIAHENAEVFTELDKNAGFKPYSSRGSDFDIDKPLVKDAFKTAADNYKSLIDSLYKGDKPIPTGLGILQQIDFSDFRMRSTDWNTVLNPNPQPMLAVSAMLL